MANQPTKYKKFVATAATATLVASAIVPVASAASFTDVNPETNSHAAAIDALVEQGIIQGYQDGTFKPNQTLTRGHVVKMLGKWVEAQGFEVPADWNTVARFSDLAVDNKDQELVKYAAVVKDAGVFNGSNGALNAAGSITRENMALTLDRAYAAVFGQSLVEEAAGLVDLTVSDLASAKEEAREAIQALRNLEVSNVNTFMPKDAVTRAQFASFLYRTINVEGGNQTTPPTGEVAIASLKATAVNELTVEFNQAVDTNAAAFAVKRGTAEEIKVSKVEWNEAGTVATLTVDHKFVDATYNLTVTGLAEEALTASVTTTTEVASEIKFNNDKLVLTGKKSTDGEALEARITFEVYNQYGEIITDKISESYYSGLKLKGIDTLEPKLSSGTALEVDFDSANKGTIVAWVDKKEDEGEEGTISFTYEFGDIEIDVDQDVVLSDDLEPGSVKIEGIHSENGYEFTAKNVEKYGKNDGDDLQDEFFLLLSVKDQYGNDISAKDAKKKYSTGDATFLEIVKDGLRVSVSEDEIFDADEDNLTTVTVDGKEYYAIQLEFEFTNQGYVEQTGENTVSIRSKATGEVAESKITLSDSSKVYSIGLSAPSEVVASDETVKLPITAVDQSGNAITDAAKLNDDVNDKGRIKFSGDFVDAPTFINENGQLFLEFTSLVNGDDKKAKDMDVEVEVVDSKQESELTLKVQPKAYAATLVKLNSDVATSLFLDQAFELEHGDFVVEDQYGRVFDKNHTIKVVSVKGSSLVVKGNDTLAVSGDELEFATTATKGTTTVEFELISADNTNNVDYPNGKPVTSKISTTFRTLDETDFDSYKVKGETVAFSDFGETAVQDKDGAEVKVYGITAAGKEVLLPISAYSLKAEKYLNANYAALLGAENTSEDTVTVTVDNSVESKMNADNVDKVKSSVTIVINRTGQVITQEITASREEREFATLSIKDDSTVTGEALTKLKLTATEANGSLTGDFLTELFTVATVEAKDQYGNKAKEAALKVNTDLKFVISNVNSSNDKYVISQNGGNGASISGLAIGDSYDVTVKIDNAVKTIKVQIVSDTAK